MLPPSSLAARPGLALGVLCGVAGLALGSPETGLLGALVGYFLGKSLRSVRRTVEGGRAG